MANPFVHVELAATDVGKAKDFYGKLFAWKLEDRAMPTGSYTMIGVDDEDGIGGGMIQHPMPGAPSGWVPYVAVDDVVASTAKATSLGAVVLRDITDIPGMGRFSILQDPIGGVIGLWESTREG